LICENGDKKRKEEERGRKKQAQLLNISCIVSKPHGAKGHREKGKTRKAEKRRKRITKE